MDPFLLSAILVAIIGTTYASYSDLKTTEVSDWVPITMSILGVIINGIHSFVSWDYTYVVYSLGIGIIYLLYGVIMYKLGQWGGADAAILASLGTLVPLYPGFSYFGLPIPYQLGLVLNIYMLGAVYALFYAMVLAFKNQKVFKIFNKDLKDNWKRISFYFILICTFIIGTSGFFSYYTKSPGFFYQSITGQLALLPLFLLLLIYWRFAKVIETHVFRWKVSTKKLNVGDMLAEDVVLPNKTIPSKLLEGLTIRQVSEIKKHKKYVMIKEGIRFIPAFLLGFIFTLIMRFLF